MVSYYFTLFKKFQVFDHVPEGTFHGAPGGHAGFDLNNPAVLFTMSGTGDPLGTTLPTSPIYQLLYAKYLTPSNMGFVTVGGSSWPVMPRVITQAWTDLQMTPPAGQGTLDAFVTWFNAGHANDTPTGVIALMPPTIPSNQLGTPDTVFVCSYATDVGIRTGNPVPADFWETSLIYVTDPATGAIQPNAPLNPGAKYNLVAVVGSRYSDAAGIGQYMYGGSTDKTVQAQAWVMVWNAGMGPGVQLPSLSNQNMTTPSGIYDLYMLKQGHYDLVGFEFDVQRAFDGLVQAVVSQMGMTEAQAIAWLTASQQGAHLCSRVVIARTGGASPDSWPTAGDLPTANARVAQRNLSAFPINITDTGNPYPTFHAFAMGDPMAMIEMHGDDRWGNVQLIVRPEIETGIRLYLAASRETVKKWFPRATLRQLTRVDMKPADKCDERLRLPFDDTVVFELPREGLALDFPRLGGTMLPLSLGIQYDVKKLKPGRVGVVRVEQRTLMPRLLASEGKNAKKSYELEYKTGGGFTLEIEAYNPHLPPHRPKPAGAQAAQGARKPHRAPPERATTQPAKKTPAKKRAKAARR